jgi:HEPN domain-containing protein
MKRLSPYRKQAAEWVKYAENDLKVAQDNLKLANFPFVCYLAQQSTEKFLKAFLISCGVKPPQTHLLRELVKSCQKINVSFGEIDAQARKLEEYYIPTRYPVGVELSTYNKKEAQTALKLAQTIIDFIKKLLK